MVALTLERPDAPCVVELNNSTKPLAQYAQDVILPALPHNTIGPAIRKQPIHDWKQYQGKPGIVGTPDDWRSASGVYVMATDELCAVSEYDDPAEGAAILAKLPILDTGAGWKRGNHGGWIVRLHHAITDKGHVSIKDENGDELASLRLKGAIQVVTGRHWDKEARRWSGDRYTFNGLPMIALSAQQTDTLAAIFKAKNRPGSARPVASASHVSATADDWQVKHVERWIDGYLENIRTQSAGRNQAINNNALKIGQLAHYINNDNQLIDQILAAAEACGYVQKDGLAATLATILSGFDAGKEAPRYPFTKTQRATVQAQPETVTSVPESASAALPYPDELERCVNQFWRHAAKSVNRLLRAVFTYYGAEPFTLTDLAAKSGIDHNALWRAMEQHGGSALCQVNCSLTSVLAHHERELDCPIGQTAIKSTERQKQGTVYRLLPYADLIDALLTKVIAPDLADREKLARATLSRLQALGVNGDPALVTDINTRLECAYTPDEKRADLTAWQRIQDELSTWRKRLSDRTATPLPDGWHKDYAAAVVARNTLPVLGERQTWKAAEKGTGMRRKAIQRTENRLGITRDETYSDQELVATAPGELPALKYDRERGGFPARVVLLDRVKPTGELPTYDYRGDAGQHAAQDATRQGERVRIEYQTASIPRYMTEAERADYQARRTVKRPAKPAVNPVEKPISRPPHVGPGSDPVKALRWLSVSELALRLPDDPALSVVQRVYRLAGRENVYTPSEVLEILHSDPESEPEPISVDTAQSEPPHTASCPSALDTLAQANGLTLRNGAYHDDDLERTAKAIAYFAALSGQTSGALELVRE